VSNFVDDIVDDSEDEFWIAASYVSVFKSRRPRLLRGQTNILWRSWMASISTQDSA